MTGKSSSPFPGERLAKRIARAGVCSRREAEALIADGKVKVNGKIIISPALNVTGTERIEVKGKLLPEAEQTRLWLYHKPAGLVTTRSDEKNRQTVFSALPASLPRVISVGRLDINTEGLLLLTNDGALARTLELPATGWIRRYRARAYGNLSTEMQQKLARGVTVDGVRYGKIDIAEESRSGANAWVSIKLTEGKNREIRKVFEHFDCSVNRLIRVSYGPFQLGNLPVGEVKEVPARTLRELLGSKMK